MFHTGAGGDNVLGEAGDDMVYAADNRDHVFGGGGRDFLWGGFNDDDLFGGPDNDILGGNTGWDEFAGGIGSDICFATTFAGGEPTSNCESVPQPLPDQAGRVPPSEKTTLREGG
jgi:Ca2+-binding RTX toxin-like protein